MFEQLFSQFSIAHSKLDHKIMSTVNLSIYLVSSISQRPPLALAIFLGYSSTNSLVHLDIMSTDACTNSKMIFIERESTELTSIFFMHNHYIIGVCEPLLLSPRITLSEFRLRGSG